MVYNFTWPSDDFLQQILWLVTCLSLTMRMKAMQQQYCLFKQVEWNVMLHQQSPISLYAACLNQLSTHNCTYVMQSTGTQQMYMLWQDWTLDTNFEVNFVEQDDYVPPAMASKFQSYFHELLLSCSLESLSSSLAGLVLECSNVIIVGGAEISLPVKCTLSNRCIFPYHWEW